MGSSLPIETCAVSFSRIRNHLWYVERFSKQHRLIGMSVVLIRWASDFWIGPPTFANHWSTSMFTKGFLLLPFLGDKKDSFFLFFLVRFCVNLCNVAVPVSFYFVEIVVTVLYLLFKIIFSWSELRTLVGICRVNQFCSYILFHFCPSVVRCDGRIFVAFWIIYLQLLILLPYFCLILIWHRERFFPLKAGSNSSWKLTVCAGSSS